MTDFILKDNCKFGGGEGQLQWGEGLSIVLPASQELSKKGLFLYREEPTRLGRAGSGGHGMKGRGRTGQ